MSTLYLTRCKYEMPDLREMRWRYDQFRFNHLSDRRRLEGKKPKKGKR